MKIEQQSVYVGGGEIVTYDRVKESEQTHRMMRWRVLFVKCLV